MLDFLEKGTKAIVTLYRIGYTNDSYRGPLFKTDKEKAIKFLVGELAKKSRPLTRGLEAVSRFVSSPNGKLKK